MAITLGELAAKHRSTVTVVAMLLLMTSVFMIVRRIGSGGPKVAVFGGQSYFYDLSDQTLFADDNAYISPFTTPSGSEAVRAVVYACGDCSVETDRRVAYLSRYTEDARRRLEKAGNNVTAQLMDDVSLHGRQVALPAKSGDGPQWIDMSQPAAMRIVEYFRSTCGTAPATECSP